MCTDVVRFGDTLYAGTTAADEDIAITDIIPETLSLDNYVNIPGGGVFGLAIAGTTLLAANAEAGLVALDASDPEHPVQVDALALPGDALSVAAEGDLAAVGTAAGVSLVDISDPTDLRLLASVAGPESTHLSLRGDLLAASSGPNGTIYLYDLANPHHPRLFLTTGPGVPVLGDGVLYAQGLSSLDAFDLLGTVSIVERGAVLSTDSAFGVTIHDGMAYLADYTGGLRIIDLDSAGGPAEVGAFPSADRSYETRIIETTGGLLACYADGAGGLRIIDVTVPDQPLLVGVLVTSDLAIALDVKGSLAFVGTRFDGLQIVDISDPAMPIPAGSIDTPGSAQSVTVVENLAYVADGTAGVQIVRYAGVPEYAGSGRGECGLERRRSDRFLRPAGVPHCVRGGVRLGRISVTP